MKTDSAEKILLLCLFLAFVSLEVAYINFFNILKVPCCSNSDWFDFHYPNIQRLLRGDLTSLSAYPPFFTMSMSLVAWLPTQYLGVLISSILFGLILFFAYRIKGAIIATMIGLMLLSSLVFLSYSMSLLPTVTDVILFLIASIFLFEKKLIPSATALLFLMYNHQLGIFWFLIVFFYSLFYKRDFLKYLAVVFILSLPMLYAYALPSIIGSLTGSIFTQMFIPYTDPFFISLVYPLQNFLKFSGIILWILLPVTLYSMYRFRSYSEVDAFYFLWMLMFAAFAEVDPRWTFLFVIPFSIFEGFMISKLIKKEVFFDEKNML